MVFNPTFNNISALSWRSVLLVEETWVPEKTTDLSKVPITVYHIMMYRVHLARAGFELTTLVVIGTDCTGGCRSNYHTSTTAPSHVLRRLIHYAACWISFYEAQTFKASFWFSFFRIYENWIGHIALISKATENRAFKISDITFNSKNSKV